MGPSASAEPILSLLLPWQEFIEELLAPGFGGMIAFVKEVEGLAERGQLERLRGEEGEWGTDLWGGGEQEEEILAPLISPLSLPHSPGDTAGARLRRNLEGFSGDSQPGRHALLH